MLPYRIIWEKAGESITAKWTEGRMRTCQLWRLNLKKLDHEKFVNKQYLSNWKILSYSHDTLFSSNIHCFFDSAAFLSSFNLLL